MSIVRNNCNFLVDDASGDVVGIKDADGSEQQLVFSGSGKPVELITFNTNPSRTATNPGELGYNAAEGTLDFVMNSGYATQQIGLETYYRVKNQTGATLTDGTVVRAVGAVGNSGHILVDKMVGDGSIEPHYLLGVVTHDITNGDDGFATHFGLVRGVSTNGSAVSESWADGQVLWVHPTTPGALTKTEPTAPAVKMPVAMVVNAHASNGSMFVRPTIGSHVNDLYDVKASVVNDLALLQYNEATNTWDSDSYPWVDIDFPIVARSVATNNPTPVTLINNITAPQWAVNDYLVCEGQEMIHGWKEGSDVRWHCHLITNGQEAVAKYVRFEVEFAFAYFGGVVTAGTTITSADIEIAANTPTKTHILASIGTWTPPAEVKIGSQVYARLKRVASVGTAPVANPWCTMLQMHIQCDTIGSRNVGSKL